MKKLIVLFISIFLLFNAVLAQSPNDYRIRKIGFDFLVSKGEVDRNLQGDLYLTQVKERSKQNDLEVIASVLWINDLTNKKVIEGEESIPIQEDLIQYSVRSLNPHGLSYLMLVKNGVYEFLDMSQRLDNILEQVLFYSRNNAVTSDELLDILETTLLMYKDNNSMHEGISGVEN